LAPDWSYGSIHAIAASGFQAPGTDQLLVSIRKAMSTIQAAGDLRHALDGGLDKLVLDAISRFPRPISGPPWLSYWII
jgi:hypothetical protein